MHSSRMRTVRNSSRPPGGVPAWGAYLLVGTCPGGVYLPRGVPARGGGTCPERCTCLGGVPAGGGGTCPERCTSWGVPAWGVYLLGVYLPRGRGTYPVGGCTFSRGDVPAQGMCTWQVVPARGVYLLGGYLPRYFPPPP